MPTQRSSGNGRSGNGYFVRIFDCAVRHGGRISIEQCANVTGSSELDARFDLLTMMMQGRCLFYAGSGVYGIPDESVTQYRR